MLEQPDRYKRLPYMSTARMLTAFIEAKGIGQVVLDEHGIDLAKYRSDSYFVYVAYNELGGEAERAEFCERAFRMIECLGLVDEFDDFSDGKIFEEIECWCRDNGYSLYGSWSDWDDPNNVDRFLRGEA